MDSLLIKPNEAEPQNFEDPRLASPIWRMNNLYWIMDKEGDRVKFKLNHAQKKFYNEMWYLNIILKARQLGFSTFIMIFMLDRCLFSSNVRAGVIADTLVNATTLFRDKLKFAYDNLPQWLIDERGKNKNAAGELLFENNSSIRVGTSLRGGTLQYLHISEHGKICAKNPIKAEEVKTGALNTVKPGRFVFIESTAEGAHGDFHDFYKTAEARVKTDGYRTKLDYQPFFFDWFSNPDYVVDAEDAKHVEITNKMAVYFKMLQSEHDIHLTHEQKVWYQKMRDTQGNKMLQEFPSYPDEAFNQPVEGAYFRNEVFDIYDQGRLLKVPYNPRLPVNTFWDLGIRETDTTCIIFHQRDGMQDLFIDYHEDHSQGLQEYARILMDKEYRYDTHYLPHDGSVREIGNEAQKRWLSLEKTGLKGDIETVDRCLIKADAIDRGREVLPFVVIDKDKCSRLYSALGNYRREWDEKNEVWRQKPLHNWASNPVDAFFTFSDGYVPPAKYKPPSLSRSGSSIATI